LFRNAGMQTVADNPPTDASTFRQSISDGLLHVASRDHDLAGFTLALETGSDCHLEQMSVDPAFGRQGIGTELLRHLIILATARKLARVTLSTFTHLAWNGPFYERFGFARVADSDLTPALVEARKQEAAAGLDMTVRAIMALRLRTERT
jgi:GNAT superfamily N-acetyltransferase